MRKLVKSQDRKICGVCGVSRHRPYNREACLGVGRFVCGYGGADVYSSSAPHAGRVGAMIATIIYLAVLMALFGLAFRITGALLKACLWLFVLLPIAFILWGIALVCCCTLLLIPVGVWLFKAGASLLTP